MKPVSDVKALTACGAGGGRASVFFRSGAGARERVGDAVRRVERAEAHVLLHAEEAQAAEALEAARLPRVARQEPVDMQAVHDIVRQDGVAHGCDGGDEQ